MAKVFNTVGCCEPELNYMVDLTGRLTEIKGMVDAGLYFTMNRARQFGKTTILTALAEYLKKDYETVYMDFQTMSSLAFESEQSFVAAFSEELLDLTENLPDDIEKKLASFAGQTDGTSSLQTLFKALKKWCAKAERKIVLIIDEVDAASNDQVFVDFLAQLRAYYLRRRKFPAFQSVILAGVYDVRSVRRKIRPDGEHIENSPWNIAARFDIDMSFSSDDIAGMLREYEKDYHTGMDITLISGMIYAMTSGYPYLVSGMCKYLDEEIAGTEKFKDKKSAWTKEGVCEAERMLVKEDNTLYQSMIRKLKLYPKLRTVLYELLFTGRPIPYTATNDYMKDAVMFGFIRNEKDTAVVFNQIFESVLYNYFIAEEFSSSEFYKAGVQEKNQFIVGGHLDVRKVLEKFVETFDYLYGDQDVTFYEDVGRRYFLLFLKPIINGVGNYSVESRTRNNERMDLVLYYRGEQSVIEIKIWRGNAYNERGEEQLSDYLDYFHLNKGYMLSFNFNKKKEIGVKEIRVRDKILIEAVV